MKVLFTIAIFSILGFSDSEEPMSVEGKYQWYFIGVHNLNIKKNNKFKSRSRGPRVNGKSKGSWTTYQNNDEYGIILTYENKRIDTLQIMKNGNLSPNPKAIKEEIIIYEKR